MAQHGRCTICGFRYGLRADGCVRRHKDLVSRVACPGGDWRPMPEVVRPDPAKQAADELAGLVVARVLGGRS